MDERGKNTLLLVDDAPENLDILVGVFSSHYRIKVALSGEKALELCESESHPDLILLDIMMPAMDGYEVCRRLKAAEQTKHIPVIFVTAKDDAQDETRGLGLGAVDYITKPINPAIVKARVETHLTLFTARKSLQEMLEKTLAGSVKVLSEVLALSNPIAFSRSSRLKQYVKEIIGHLQLPDSWQFEIAAMLSSIGCLSLSTDTLERINQGAAVSEEEQALFDTHPKVGSELLVSIPHLKPVADIIAGQMDDLSGEKDDIEKLKQTPVELGRQILKAVIDFDNMTARGKTASEAVQEMLELNGVYNPKILSILRKTTLVNSVRREDCVSLNNLRIGMIVDQDVVAESGVLLLKKGSEVTESVMKSLFRFSQTTKIKQPIMVLC